jgi:hypothetical protein
MASPLGQIDSEALQNAVLAFLQEHGEIADSRDLVLPTPTPVAVSPATEDQLILRGALDSLTLREVSRNLPSARRRKANELADGPRRAKSRR